MPNGKQATIITRMLFISRCHIFITATVIVLGGCSKPLWEPPEPGRLMAERESPDGSFLAQAIATNTGGTYTLEVRDARTGALLVAGNIAAPVGYHAHVVTLAWRKDGRRITATIDHDFGDDNRVLNLNVERANTQ